jgi:uncharacterized repeat protein (TIGR01451 family)
MHTIHPSGSPALHARAHHSLSSYRRRVAAWIAASLVAVSLTATALTATPAHAAAEPDLVRLAGWTVSGATASVRLPGNGAALGQVRYSASGQEVVVEDEGTSARAYPTAGTLNAHAGCITNRQRTGVPHSCRTDTVTITFPQKIANPHLWFGVAGGAMNASGAGGADKWCVIGWRDATIRAINGVAPAAGDVVVRASSGSQAAFSNNSLSVTPEPGWSGTCDLGMGTTGGIKARLVGLVESITIDTTLWEMLTRNDGSYSGGIAPVGGIGIAIDVPVADLAMQKAGPATVDADGIVTWDLAVANLGPAPSTGFVVKDAVPAEVTGASLVDAPPGCRLQGRDLVCAQAPPGCAATQHPTVTTWANLACTPRRAADGVVLAAGATSTPITLTGTAPGARGTVITNTAGVSGTDVDLDTINNTASAGTTVEAPTLAVRKDVAARVAPQDQFTVQAADAAGAKVASATTAGTAATAGSAPVQVRRGESYTLSEAMAPGSVSTLDRYQGEMTCVDDSTGAATPAEQAGAAWTFVPTENHPYTCALTNTPAPDVTVRVEKVGESADGDVVRMADAGFELLSDDDGRAGAPLEDVAASETETGLFEFTGLPPGAYWLRETVAPDGFALLAEPVPFSVSAAGVVSLTDPAAAPQVTADGDLLTVHDVPSFGLPEAGGPGRWALTLAGASLLALALAISAGRTRRVRRDTPQESRNNA